MRRERLLAAWALVLGLGGPGLFAEGQDPPLGVNIFHPLECLMTDELETRVYLYNQTDAEQTCQGEVADDQGRLILSGDWELTVEEVKDGKVVGSRRLGPSSPTPGQRLTVEPRGHREWKWKMPASELAGHPGNYRLRIRLGGARHTGRPFRIVKRGGAPEWVSLTYTPDKQGCFIGEPITVHFTLKNDGSDDFHFEEGGDYRGATRHLRWAFTAESTKGDQAVDPKPSQSCMGGLGMADPHVKPGKTYEKDLPLLAYLKFPSPGRYHVKCYQAMGFGEPKLEFDSSGHWGSYAYGGSFEIDLRLPTEEEAIGLLRSTFGGEKYEQRRRFASLYHPCYLKPLERVLADEKDQGRVEALVGGIGSIMTAESTRRLIALAEDDRPAARVAALGHLSWRLPDPRDAGKATHDSPFRFYSPAARAEDVKAAWDEAFRPKLCQVLEKGLESAVLDEVASCAYCLGALGETDVIDRLAQAADRVAPQIPVPEANSGCVGQIASAASLLAQLGAKPCRADERSSPGRLAVWGNMVRTKPEYRRGDWEELILHMMRLDCPATRMAAVRWLPRDFSKRDQIPWKNLFAEKDSQIWWHAIQIARQTFPSAAKAAAEEVLRDTSDDSKQRELGGFIRETEARAEEKAAG